MTITKQPNIVTRKLGKHSAHGLYWAAKRKHIKPLIELDERLKPDKALDILLHESLHHLFPAMCETVVSKSARKLMHILWGQNYRKVIQ